MLMMITDTIDARDAKYDASILMLVMLVCDVIDAK
jgi:hypothetical protein